MTFMPNPNPNQRLSQYEEEAHGFYEEGVERLTEVYHDTEELVRQNPMASSLITLGTGFAVGLLITALATPTRSRRQRVMERHLPDWASREHLMDAFSRWLPESMKSCH